MNPHHNRVIKLNVLHNENQDAILKKAKNLKTVPEPWGKVYLTKDLHPAMVMENNRIFRAKKELEKIPENKGKVKYEKGELKVDGVMKDSVMLPHPPRCSARGRDVGWQHMPRGLRCLATLSPEPL